MSGSWCNEKDSLKRNTILLTPSISVPKEIFREQYGECDKSVYIYVCVCVREG